MSNDLSGILLVDKPPRWTAHDAVAVARKVLGTKKIGHCGALDPMASGLLVMVIGKYLQRQSELQGSSKKYAADITIGQESDTWDADGEIVNTADASALSLEHIKQEIKTLTGDIEQIIPPYSAKKVNGRKLCDIAREGGEVPVITSRVNVKGWDNVSWSAPVLSADIECASGTYIRSLAYMLGRQVNSFAHLSRLRRVKCGDYEVSSAVGMDNIKTMTAQELASFVIQ